MAARPNRAPSPTVSASAGARRGAYGIALTGDALGPDAARWLPEVPADWPTWEIRRVPTDGDTRTPQASDAASRAITPRTPHASPVITPRPEHEWIDDDHCAVHLWDDAWAQLDRRARTITLHLPGDEPTGTVLHPAATLPSMVVCHWQGRLSLHAGAVLLHGGVWGVLGHKEAGKSTTLAALDAAGRPVLADDMLVYDDGDVLIGPRFVDLRAGAAERFPAAIDCGHMGLRQRFRLPLQPAPLRAPFAGWLLPAWADDHDDIAVTTVPPAERLDTLGDLLNVRRPPKHPVHLLDITAKPLLRVSRPKRFDALPACLDAILAATAEATRSPGHVPSPGPIGAGDTRGAAASRAATRGAAA